MAWKQTYNPNINIGARRGWCLKYIDDAGKAPKRTATAQIAQNNERKAKRLRKGDIPNGIWVVGYMSLNRGPVAGYGHVFFIRRDGSSYQIHDSEVHAGARSVYRSLDEIMRWFGNYAPRYEGWSTDCDGRNYAKEVATPKPAPKPPAGRVAKKGSARVAVNILNVRSTYSTSGKVVAQYSKGNKFNYDSYIIANGYVWLSYISYSGQRRYVAERSTASSSRYVTGGSGK